MPILKRMSTANGPEAQSEHHKIELFRMTKRLHLVVSILCLWNALATTPFQDEHYVVLCMLKKQELKNPNYEISD
ncbi:MAG: hypothetical protein ACI88A_004377 [Paraglaciecola sp.]